MFFWKRSLVALILEWGQIPMKAVILVLILKCLSTMRSLSLHINSQWVINHHHKYKNTGGQGFWRRLYKGILLYNWPFTLLLKPYITTFGTMTTNFNEILLFVWPYKLCLFLSITTFDSIIKYKGILLHNLPFTLFLKPYITTFDSITK